MRPVLIAFLVLLLAACDRPAAPAGLPPIRHPVGPVPGEAAAGADEANPLGEQAATLVAGRRLFLRMNCAGCHGEHGGGGMGPSLRDPVWLYGRRNSQIFDSIAHGRGKGMPAWGTRLPEAEIWKLVGYIKSLRTPREPEPPA